MFSQIEVRGPDTLSFLQAQLTQDITRASAGDAPLAAWCNPQGRVIAVMRLLALPDGIGLVVPAVLAETVLVQLQRYRLRAKVELGLSADDWRAVALSDATDLAMLAAVEMLPAATPGRSCSRAGVTAVCLSSAPHCVEIYGPRDAIDAAGLAFGAELSDVDWHAARIRAGIADIRDDNSGKYTPHMLNLDRLGAVSFTKGCYTGQEIVARTEYRGTSRRRLARYRSDDRIAAGAPLSLDGKVIGEVVSSAGGELLALVPSDAHDKALASAGSALHPAGP